MKKKDKETDYHEPVRRLVEDYVQQQEQAQGKKTKVKRIPKSKAPTKEKQKKKTKPKKSTPAVQKKASPQSRQSSVSAINKKKKKANFFPVARMWANTIISQFRSDTGTIPADIGDNIFMGDNIYITNQYMSAMIIVDQYSLETPLAYTSELLQHVKTIVPSAVVDFTFKTGKFEVDFYDQALKARVKRWQASLEDDKVKENVKNKNAWLLYSYDTLKSGKLAYSLYTFITVRAKNNDTLQRAIKATVGFLTEHNIECRHIKSNLHRFLGYESSVINKVQGGIKDFPYMICTANSLAEVLPTTQGLNDEIGLFMGIDRYSENPYLIDLKSTSRAKNFYVLAPSGEGKTFLVITWLIDAFTDDYRMSITDIKGNEFTEFTKVCGGTIISMKPGATFFVNTFKLDPEAVDDDPVLYYKEMLRVSKQVLVMVANPTPEKSTKIQSLIEDFLTSMYLMIGVVDKNTNTWGRTSVLTPYKVFEYFNMYLSPSVRKIYEDVIDDVLLNFRTYLSPNGTGADLFRSEFKIKSILDSKVVTFDYGMLGGSRVTDEVSLNLKHFFAKLITDAYVANNKEQGLHTIRVLEESQMTNSILREMYAEEISLRRAQNQINILLGNSISGLKGDRNSEIILENINIWVLGRLTKTNMDYVTKEYGMEEFEEQLVEINENMDYDRTFLVVNKLHRRTTSSMVRAFVPVSVAESEVFHVVDSTTVEGV